MPDPKTPCLTLRQVFACALGAITLVSCSKSEIQDNRVGNITTTGIKAVVQAGEAGQTLMDGANSEEKTGAKVQIPPGTLEVEQTVSMASTYHTDLTDLAKEFSIGSNINVTPTGVAVVVSSNVDKNLGQPMTIALELPQAVGLMGLVWQNKDYIVVYTVRDSAHNIWKRGIMPDSALTISDGKVRFQSQYLGRYELFETSRAVKGGVKEIMVPTPDFKNRPITITSVEPQIVQVGKTLTIHGTYLSADTKVFVGDQEVAATYTKSRTLTFEVPDFDLGTATITIKDKKSSAQTQFVAKPSSAPYITAAPADVCKGITYVDATGSSQQGQKTCYIGNCSHDNQKNCIATTDYPAWQSASIVAAEIFVGQTILGVPGSHPVPAHTKACTAAGQEGCRIQDDFVAVEKGKLTAGIVRATVTIPAKIAGTATDMMGKYPSPIYPLPGVSGTALTENNFVSAVADDVGKTYQYWDVTGKVHEFKSEGTLTANKILQDVSIFGVKGNWLEGTPAPCKNVRDTDCLVEGEFRAASTSDLKASNIRKNAIVALQMGIYPSATYPLEYSASDVQLTNADFAKRITSDQPFVYYTSAGDKVTATGTNQLTADKIRNGVKVFGVTGTLQLADPNYYKPEYIRYGLKYGDVTGTRPFKCRTQADQEQIKYQGSLGKSGLDPFDTIPDGLRPDENPWGEDHPEYNCAGDAWVDITVNPDNSKGCTTLTQNCLFKNKYTGKIWGGYTSTKRNFNSAWDYCADLQVGDLKDWSMPSVHKLMTAYFYGLGYVGGSDFMFFQQDWLWSVTVRLGAEENKHDDPNVPVRAFHPHKGTSTEKYHIDGQGMGICVHN